jgi:hypothetical protein
MVTTNDTPLDRSLCLNPRVTQVEIIRTIGDAVLFITKLDAVDHGDAPHWMIAASALEAADNNSGNEHLLRQATDAMEHALKVDGMLLDRCPEDVLVLIASLHDELRLGAPSFEQVTAWWDRVERIEGQIATDSRATKREEELLQLLKEAVSDAIASARKGRKPDTSRISPTLTGLQFAIERRTIGPNGEPIR